MAASDRHIGQTIAGKYLVERSLGHGGMGEVYVAVQAPLGRRVALKLVRRDMADDDKALARFEREAKALAQLTDPHIVTIHDFGVTEAGELFMAMELVDGESLRARLRRDGALEPLVALRIAQGILGGLAAAHHANVVHRDLKPENVMLTRVSSSNGLGNDFVKVLDFGVARMSDAKTGVTPGTLTETGKLVGTPGYMAPEMLLYGVLDDPRSDLYAVGVILFEMLCGEAPFDAPTPIALVMKHAHEAPPRLSDVVVGIPAEVEALVHDLLRKEPVERPANAALVIERLAKITASPLPTVKASGRGVDVNAKTVQKMATPQSAALPPSEAALTEPEVAMPPAPRGAPRALWFGAAIVMAAGLGALTVLGLSKMTTTQADAAVAPPAPPAPALVDVWETDKADVVEVRATPPVVERAPQPPPRRPLRRPRSDDAARPPPPTPPPQPDLTERHVPDLR